MIVFAGGWSDRIDDHFEAYSFVEFPKEDSDTASFTMSVSDVIWQKTATLPVTMGKGATTGMVLTPEMRFPTSAQVSNAERTKTSQENGLLCLTFWLQGDEMLRNFRANAVGADGRKWAPVHETGAYVGRRFKREYYFRARPTDLRAIELDSYPSRELELIDVRIKPLR